MFVLYCCNVYIASYGIGIIVMLTDFC